MAKIATRDIVLKHATVLSATHARYFIICLIGVLCFE
jgi:hypothetical protein